MPLLRLPFYCLCMKIIQSSVPFISSEAMKHQWKKTKKVQFYHYQMMPPRHSKRLLNITSSSAWFIILVYSQPYCIVLGKLVATSYKSGESEAVWLWSGRYLDKQLLCILSNMHTAQVPVTAALQWVNPALMKAGYFY